MIGNKPGEDIISKLTDAFIARPRHFFQLLFCILFLIWQSLIFVVGFSFYIIFQKIFKIKKRYFIPICFLPPLFLLVVMPVAWDSLFNLIHYGFQLNLQFWQSVFDGLIYGISLSNKISGIISGFTLVWKSGYLILFSLPISAILSLIDFIPNGSHTKTIDTLQTRQNHQS